MNPATMRSAVSICDPDDGVDLRDFWHALDRHYVTVMANVLRTLASPASASVAVEARERLRRAVEGDWSAYDAQLRVQGAWYARRGGSFAEWFTMSRAFRREVEPLLVRAYHGRPDALIRALHGLGYLVDRSNRIVTDEFVGTLEQLAARQSELAGRHAASLRASEERHRELFNCNPLPTWVFDRETLAFLEVNDAAVRHYGYSRDEFLAMTVADIRPAEDAARFREHVSHLEARGESTGRHRTRDGTIISIEAKGHELSFAGRPARLVVVKDISARVRAQAALRASEAQLQQSQKMEAVGSLAGGMAHDFNNMLTVVRTYSELVLGALEPEHPVRADVEEIRRAGERGTDLTRQLLAFSRRQVVEPVILDLNVVIGDLDRMLRRLIGADIDLRTIPCDGLEPVRADRGQLEQVLVNLVVNARDAMPQGGTLIVETGRVTLDEDEASQRLGIPAGTHVLLAVTDTGHGMDAETQARIFEPFFTTKEVGKGTGLGLSMVYGIVQQSGGSIWVNSALGKGTTFKVLLPAVGDAIATRASRPTTGNEEESPDQRRPGT